MEGEAGVPSAAATTQMYLHPPHEQSLISNDYKVRSTLLTQPSICKSGFEYRFKQTPVYRWLSMVHNSFMLRFRGYGDLDNVSSPGCRRSLQHCRMKVHMCICIHYH